MGEILADGLSKSFAVADKDPGLRGTLRHFMRRQYRQIDAVRSVSFSIEPGEIVGFLGPNGAGKTTTLKMLTGLICPSGGRVSVGGHRPFDREAAFLRRITLVMGQKQQLVWDLPTLDSLRINAAVYGIPEGEAMARVAELSEMLELTDKLRQPVRKLSLGERMKAEVLAALLHRPEILFLDEPTLGLDVNAQGAMRAFLKDYNRRFGATVLLTSHYMADITALCPRVLMIHEGGLIFDGTLQALIDRFAPLREVTLTLSAEPIGVDLAVFGEEVSREGRILRILVRREALAETLGRLLRTLEVGDLSVSEPPIESIIAEAFTRGEAL